MKKRYKKRKRISCPKRYRRDDFKIGIKRFNFLLFIAALLSLLVSVITVSYSWIESAVSLNINNKGGTEGYIISVNAQNPGIASISAGNLTSVDLTQYLDFTDSDAANGKLRYFLAPAKLDSNGDLTIRRSDGTFSVATTNDICNNYIEYDVPFTVDKLYKFSFSSDSAITVTGTKKPLKLSLSVDGGAANVFDGASLAGKTAFIASSGSTHYLKVRIWLDATNESDAEAIKGKPVTIKMNLVPSTDVPERTVTINAPSSSVAALTTTYTLPGSTTSVTPGSNVFKVSEGAKVTVKANMLDSLYKFNSFTVTGSTGVTQNEKVKSVEVVVQGNDIQITPDMTKMAVAECAQEILNGTNVSFYAGNAWGATTTYYYSAADATKKAINTPLSSIVNLNCGTVSGENRKGVPSGSYSLTNDASWGGVAMASEAVGGTFYYLNSDGQDVNNRIDSIQASSAATALSSNEVKLNSTGVKVTTSGFSSAKTAIGTDLYVQHFIKEPRATEYTLLATSGKISATNNQFVTDISSYLETTGEYEIKTVLTDGTVYYVTDTASVNVVETQNVTVKSASNAKLEVRDSTKVLGTINAGDADRKFEVYKGTKVTVTATPLINTGVYDFQWTSTGKTIPKDKNNETSTYSEVINRDTTIGVTVDNHCFKLTYKGVTAEYDSDSYVPAGTDVTLTFKDSGNRNKVVWSVNGVEVQTTPLVKKGEADTYTVTMDENKDVTATATVLYELVYSIKGESSSYLATSLSEEIADTAVVDGEKVTKYVAADSDVTFTVTKPDADNYYTVDWKTIKSTISGSETGTVSGGHIKSATETKSYTITSDTTVEVTVTKSATYPVTINKPNNASLTATYTVSGNTEAIYNIDLNGATLELPEGAKVEVTATEFVGYRIDGFTIKKGIDVQNTTDNPATVTVGKHPVEITVKTSELRTLYFKNNLDWGNVKAYAFGDGTEWTAWADSPDMTLVDNTNNIWRIDNIPDTYTSIIFHNGAGGDNSQTVDLTIPNDGKNLFTPDTTPQDKKYDGTWSVYSEIVAASRRIYLRNTASEKPPIMIWYWSGDNNYATKDGYNWETNHPEMTALEGTDNIYYWDLTGESVNATQFIFHKNSTNYTAELTAEDIANNRFMYDNSEQRWVEYSDPTLDSEYWIVGDIAGGVWDSNSTMRMKYPSAGSSVVEYTLTVSGSDMNNKDFKIYYSKDGTTHYYSYNNIIYNDGDYSFNNSVDKNDENTSLSLGDGTYKLSLNIDSKYLKVTRIS